MVLYNNIIFCLMGQAHDDTENAAARLSETMYAGYITIPLNLYLLRVNDI